MFKEIPKRLLNLFWPDYVKIKIKNVTGNFSPSEKVVFYFLSVVLIVSGLSLLYRVNESFLISVPASGGSLSEGIIGTPRFINPVLAISDTDRDLTTLIYSGLMRIDENGNLVKDLAESYKISEDGTIYTFTLRKDVYFHNGSRITSADIDFTIGEILDPKIKSPKRSSWDQVKVEVVDDRVIRFVLKQPYTPFIQNTTVGILPKDIWKNVDADSFLFSNLNIKPIGSGPYKVDTIKNNSAGTPSQYTLSPFKKYILGEPYISNLILKFYNNETEMLKAYENKDIESMNSISPEKIKNIAIKNGIIKTSTLPRVFGIFLNQNISPIFANKEVRLALDKSLDKKKIVNEVLYGFGEVINGPLPKDKGNDEEQTQENRLIEARKILEEGGWKLNSFGIYEKKGPKETERLTFSISTADTPELKQVAEIVKESWHSLGAEVELKIFEIGDLNQNIIRPRKYDGLLFGEIVGRDLDLYPFWHSSQRNDPGLNISLYTNIKVDKIVENLRKSQDEKERELLIQDFETEITKDIPAIFIYSPYFTYIYPNKIQNVSFENPTIPGERFSNISKWFIETNKIWKIFKSN
jgi:peptide/nickel transport system substrate-binding protein